MASRWRRLVESQQRSGLGVAAWCRANGVVPVTFYAWRRRLAAESSSPSARFVELTASPALASRDLRIAAPDAVAERRDPAGQIACPPLELRLRHDGRMTLRLRRGFDASLLRELLAALREEQQP